MTGRCGNAPNWYVAEVRPALRVLKVPSQSPSHMVFGCGRGSTRFEGTESLNDLYGLSELEVVAEVRPALRVLKDVASDLYTNCAIKWQRFDPL